MTPSRTYRVERVTLRVVREGGAACGPLRLNAPEIAVRAIRDLGLLPDEARERMVVLLLDAQLGLIGVHEVSVGTLSASLAHPREVFRAALLTPGTASMILVHNHPSGDPTPSPEDLRLTRQLAEAGRLLDIRIHDHLIVGDGTDRYISIAETRPETLSWPSE